jgi:hypothetical protein
MPTNNYPGIGYINKCFDFNTGTAIGLVVSTTTLTYTGTIIYTGTVKWAGLLQITILPSQ